MLGWLFNVVLFAPVALFATVLTRRPWRVACCLIPASFAIETAQELFLTGRPDELDVLANSIGALAGAAIGAFLLSKQREPAST